MRKSFNVAGHVFSVSIPQGYSLWKKMRQYAPFEVDNIDNPIFEIELVEALPPLPQTNIYAGEIEPGEPVLRLFNDGSDYAFEMAPWSGRPISGRCLCDASFSKAQLLIQDPAEELFALNNSAMLLYAFRTAGLLTLEVHASVIVNSGKAFLWMAKSGTGKSTHSKLWLSNIEGSHLLNDDNPIVRVLPSGAVQVYGSPWSGKTPCYKNEHYPAAAFVEIKRSPDNKISPKNLLESYALIYSSSSGLKTDPKMGEQLHKTFEKIVTSSPCFTLQCRPDADAARVSSAKLLTL